MKTKKILSLLLASIMLLGLITVPTTAADTSTDTYALDEATELLAAPTINGKVLEDEWGKPVVVTNSAHAKNTWGENGHILSDAANYDPEQRAKVWLTNDNDFIYVAATLDHEDQGDNWTTNDRNHPRFEILLSQKGEGNGPVLVNGKDQYTKLSIGFKENGVQSLRERNYVNIDSALMDHSAFSYSAKFENSTYTYELKIPFAMTNINLKESEDIAVSILICAANHGGANNRYNIGGTGCYMANANSANAQNQCMIMKLREACYVENTATKFNAAPTINGTVTEEEWGKPVVVTNSAHANDMWGENGHILSDAANYDPEQRAKVWLTNDNDFIYVATTLDHEDQGDNWTTNDRNHPRFEILLSQKGEGNGPVLVNGKDQYTKLSIGFKDNGVQGLRERTYANIDSALMDHSAFSYSAKFENSTYTYELKIPFAMTNIEFKDSTEIAVSILICAANHGGVNNRYNIGGTGCSKAITNSANAQDQCLIMTLNDVQNPEAAIDGINYPTLEAALTAATSGQTVTLLADATVDQWADEVGITLDLNGYVLTANTITASAPQTMVLDSKDGVGGIKIAKNDENATNLTLNPRNLQLPLYDAEFDGYRFFNCTLEHRDRWKVENKKYQFGYVLKMSDAAFALLKDSDSDDKLDADIELVYTISLTVDGVGVLNEVYTFSAKLMTEATSNASPTLGVTGFDQVKDQVIVLTSSNPMIESSTGVIIVPEVAELALTYSNAQ